IDDIAMWRKSTGEIQIWENGQASDQRYAGTLDQSQWEVAAVGDYNGDGREDLLLRELVTGWGGLGYWVGADAAQWTDMNARIETDMESKFAVIA
ncbi:MAG: FG-GAP repeat protein, partial [Lentisphaeria bacterium]|nr:FG-GAP repeat protein [Lentisphaeria bacterium]